MPSYIHVLHQMHFSFFQKYQKFQTTFDKIIYHLTFPLTFNVILNRQLNMPTIVDLRMPTDICYQPITDKRYNRWKRTKRKGKGGRFSVASDDSDEETSDKKVPENRSLRVNRRRRKKTRDHTSPVFKVSSNDASSEPLSDMMVDSVHSQHYNSLRSSSTESRERSLYQDGAASNKQPSWSSEGQSLN